MSRPLRAGVLCLLVVTHGPAFGAQVERTGYVMGTLLSVAVEAPDSSLGLAALDTAFALTARLDSLLSNYKPDSELNRIARGAPGPVPVSTFTFDFLARTLAWCRHSEGALDFTVGPLVRAWGFDSEHPTRPAPSALDSLRLLCGFRHVVLDSALHTAKVPAGFGLDPGATGKGYALAVADSVLSSLGVRAWRADFGGQLYVRGTDSVVVPVRHPRSDTTALAFLALTSGSVATSGDYERFFEEEGVRYAHILDPRSGLPVQGRAAVTVYAPDPFAADALSTLLFVLGPERSAPLLDRAGAGALFAEWKGDSLAIIIVGQWPEAR